MKPLWLDGVDCSSSEGRLTQCKHIDPVGLGTCIDIVAISCGKLEIVLKYYACIHAYIHTYEDVVTKVAHNHVITSLYRCCHSLSRIYLQEEENHLEASVQEWLVSWPGWGP